MAYEFEMRPDLLVKFFARIDRGGPNECWEWTGGRTKAGYGETWTGSSKAEGRRGRVVLTHRVAYSHLVGPIPEGLTIDHLCRNRACCNPAHLEPVTNKTNILRGTSRSAVNATRTHCPKGHPYNEANTYIAANGSRLCRTCNVERSRGPNYSGPGRRTDLDPEQIVQLRDSGLSWREVAEVVQAAEWTCRNRYHQRSISKD